MIGVASVLAISAFGQFKVDASGALPDEAAKLAPALSKSGVKVLKADGSVLLEMWPVAAAPGGGGNEQNTSWTGVTHGSLLGVVRFPARHSDRRGQTIKPGVYTMRYSFFPMNGDHQGVAPQRDFAVLSPIDADTDAAAKPAFDALIGMSKKASGTPHPLVLSIWKDEAGATQGIEAQGDVDQVLHTKIGGAPVAIIVAGKYEG